MEFRQLGYSGLKVPVLSFGTGTFGGRGDFFQAWGNSDVQEATRLVDICLEAGVNFFDTADVYSKGVSEEILGKALAQDGRRQRAVIATKVGLDWRDGKPFRNGSRKRIMTEVDDSLRRLRTDYIDIYQVHWPDPLVPVEESAEAMRSLYEQGKIRAIGVSNFSVAQLERFRRVAPLHVLQSPYNIFERDIEAQILPYCRAHDIATFGYGALCRGLLSGRMRPDTRFDGDDLRRIDPKFQPPQFAQYLDAVHRLDQLAQRRFRRRVIHLAVRWMLDQGISVALWGGRHPDQLEPVVGVAGWSLNDTDRQRIERIVNTAITDPVGPEFMAPPQRVQLAASAPR